MKSKKSSPPMGGSFVERVKNIKYKLPQIVACVLLLFVVWEAPPPSFLSFSSLSASRRLQIFLSSPVSNEYAPTASTFSESTAAVPTVESTDSHHAEQDSQTKKRPIETGRPDPGESASPVNNTTINQITTSDVFAEEDTQPVEEPAVQVQDAQLQPAEEKYLVPLLHPGGAGNQLVEYKSAATIARALNRTLCLIPFFEGPNGHLGDLGDRHSGLVMEDRYDTEVLSKFVKVIAMDECVQKCESRVDEHWRLGNYVGRRPNLHRWFKHAPESSFNFTDQYEHWTSTADVAASLGPRNDAKCVELGGLFPGLQRWRGMVYATSTYMQHSQRIMKAADVFQKRALGPNDSNYLSVHWRFEEIRCRKHSLGLCFRRCTDAGNNMTRDGKQHIGKTGSKRGLIIKGVIVRREDVSGAIYDRAVQHGMHTVYLASDGWLRGSEGAEILKWVVNDLRSKGLNVSGLWVVEDLPNFGDGFYVNPAAMPDLFGLDKSKNVSDHMIALVEQEICLRSSVFVGTSQSTWSSAVAETRAGRRRKQELTAGLLKGLNPGTPPEVMEQEIIDKILTLQYTSWPTCHGSYNATMNGTSIAKAEGEARDGWLDYDACDDRLLRGVGQCIRSILK